MKKYVLLLPFMMFSLLVSAQKAVISFDEKTFDFGTLSEDGGKVTHVFQFTNKGNGPLVIKQVQSSCGCTTPVWTKEPIEPGKKGSITVTYSPLGRPYPFTKPVTVYSNAVEEQVTLIIKGEVTAGQSSQNSNFPFNLGLLKSNMKVIQMNNVEKGKVQARTISILNAGTTVVKPVVDNLPSFITCAVSPESLKPNEDGKITFYFNSKYSSQWGPFSEEVYLNSTDIKRTTEENKITIIGNVVEDFGHLTFDQKRKSPIVELSSKKVNFGNINKGAKIVGRFKIVNRGVNPLMIRRIINNDKSIVVKATKNSIGGGHTGEIHVQLNTRNMSEGKYSKIFSVQTNDPDNSLIVFELEWKVQ